MKITEDEVRYVAALANLSLSEEEVAKLRRDLDPMEFSSTWTSSTPWMWKASNQWRKCYSRAKPTPCAKTSPQPPPLGNEAALANAPQSGAGYFKVPKAIER